MSVSQGVLPVIVPRLHFNDNLVVHNTLETTAITNTVESASINMTMELAAIKINVEPTTSNTC